MEHADLLSLCNKILDRNPELYSLTPENKEDFLQMLRDAMSSKVSYSLKTAEMFKAGETEQKYIKDAKQYSLSVREMNGFIDTIKEEYKRPTELVIKQLQQHSSRMNTNIESLTSRQIEEYIKLLYMAGKSQSTVRVIFSRINQYYDYLLQAGQLPSGINPCNELVFSEIQYNPGANAKIPTEQELLLIMDNLPVQLAVLCAITAIKAYSITQLYDANIIHTILYHKTNEEIIPVTFCFLNNESRELFPEKFYNEADEYMSGEEHFYLAYFEHKMRPDWYNKIMNDFWEYVFANSKNDPEKLSPGALFFENNQINLHSWENIIVRKIRELYSEKKISYNYTLKNIRLYAAKHDYELHHDLKRIQKLLNHTSLNTTRRYLQNVGITIVEN